MTDAAHPFRQYDPSSCSFDLPPIPDGGYVVTGHPSGPDGWYLPGDAVQVAKVSTPERPQRLSFKAADSLVAHTANVALTETAGLIVLMITEHRGATPTGAAATITADQARRLAEALTEHAEYAEGN